MAMTGNGAARVFSPRTRPSRMRCLFRGPRIIGSRARTRCIRRRRRC